MNDIVPQSEQPSNPFAKLPTAGGHINAGAVAIEQERAIAEAQGQLILAKKFPRSMAAAMADFMEACKSPEFAAQAFYSVPNRGSGPSIRFMEEAARCYGNFVFGHRELSRSEGKSEVEVYAWDMEKNNRSTRQITVMHVRDTSNGPKPLRDQNDIDGRVANVASKQMRGRIAALMPKALVAAGIAACKLTLAGGNDEPISARVARMVSAFSKFGVNTEMLAKYIGHTLDSVTVDEIADLIGVFNAIKEGAKPSEYFSNEEERADQKAAVNAAIATAPAAAQQQGKPAAAPQQRRQAAAKPQAEKPAAKPAEPPVAEEPPLADEPPPVDDIPPPAAGEEEPLF